MRKVVSLGNAAAKFDVWGPPLTEGAALGWQGSGRGEHQAAIN